MAQTQAAHPMLYQAPTMLSKEAHAELKLNQAVNYAFAQNVASVPLVLSEFAVASANYPIVFVRSDGESETNAQAQPMPMALLSTKIGSNDFVDAEGRWQQGAYIPAYVRRYPFVFATDDTSDSYVLCADMSSERLSNDEGAPLFADGEMSDTTRGALEFCNNFQRDYAMTERFASQLLDLELLQQQRLTLSRGQGPSTVLEGLMILHRENFRELADADFLALRESGALGPIYAHLASLQRLRGFK